MIRLDRFITLAFFGPRAGRTNNRALSIPVLMYHSVSRDVEEGIHPYYRMVTTPEVFSRHMALLADRGYQVMGLDAAITLLRQPTTVHPGMPAKTVVLTFDDGFSNFYTTAFPILARHGFTATVFLPTSFIETGTGRTGGQTFLSWSQVNELADHGVSFGSHTVSHGYLFGMTRVELKQELQQSKAAIEERTGRAVRCFSYPYAFPEQDTRFVAVFRNLLQTCGYACAVTTRIGTAAQGDDLFTLKRIPVNASDDPALLHAKINGGYDWMHTAQYAAKTVRALSGYHGRTGMVKWTSP